MSINRWQPTFRVIFSADQVMQNVSATKPTSPQALVSVMKLLPLTKAPGHDLITNLILKNAVQKMLAYLASLFNSCLRFGYFLKTWKHACMLMFPKPNKNHTLVTSYRSISPLPTLAKLLEKMIHSELTNNRLIPSFQFGFVISSHA